MTDKHPTPPPTGLSLGDIYYVLFRHKWKIVLISSLGLVGAIILQFVWPRPYQSEARLFIKYVMDSKSPGQLGPGDTRVRTPDDRGDNIINSELEILTSLDLAQEVATNIGPERILAAAGGGADAVKAAVLIHRNLLPEAPKKSSVIRIAFQHSDPALVQPVLAQLIRAYLNRHAEVHRGVFDDFLTTETDELRTRLTQTEDALRRAITNAGIISLEDSRKSFSTEMADIQKKLFDAQADLAERRAAVSELATLLNPKPVAATNPPASTNSLAAASPGSATNGVAAPPETVAEYKKVSALLDTLTKQEADLSAVFTAESPRRKAVVLQITENRKRKQQLEEEHPGLLAVKVSESKPVAADPTAGPRLDLVTEMAKVAALESKIKVLTNQLEIVRLRAMNLDANEGAITELQRKKELEEGRYKYFWANLEQAKIDRDLGAGRMSNISVIETPTPPFRASEKLLKTQAMLLFGSLAAALALAFFIELYLDRSLKRPIEIEARLGLPLFLSIPWMGRNGQPLALPTAGTQLLAEKAESRKQKAEIGLPRPQGEGWGEGESGVHPEPDVHSKKTETQNSKLETPEAELETPHSALRTAHSEVGTPQSEIGNRKSQIVTPSTLNSQPSTLPPPSSLLRPFWEGLRDRLITHFEIHNMTHKPKLVALTSCAEGSGVSTIAAGLAASLSETGGGNVLLVDMNLQGAAHQFHKGDLALSLDDALELEKRESALVQDNLYVVQESANGDKLPRALPRRFTHLVPRMKASDYDYIIFDMLPVSQISVTPRLARFMDMVLMVVESGKTDRDVVKRAASMLTGTPAHIGIVLNKAQTYVPKRLHQEL
jgi:uncharacterized protein involved in exopolysaccharide biosynthesis/Mrp family chromosome partitioning ATPase